MPSFQIGKSAPRSARRGVRRTITGPTLAIAEGAVIEGSIKMTSGAKPVRFVDKRAD